MFLKTLQLTNFRSYFKYKITFSNKVTIILGSNASGKTNLIEAIYLLSSGKSFRAGTEREMIKEKKEVGRVVGLQKSSLRLEVVLTHGFVLGRKAPFKRLLVNKIGRRLVDFIGNLPCVLFWPEDILLVTNSPSLRRRYLDTVLSQVDREYRRASLAYEKALRIRNKMLFELKRTDKQVRAFQVVHFTKEDFEYWDRILVEKGEVITKKREEFVKFLNQQKINFAIAKSLRSYQNSNNSFNIEYKKNKISAQRLKSYQERERAAGMTLVGPHRDDFIITKNFKNLSIYGSRGEQRLGVLWLKLGEVEFISEKLGMRPTLLLDDIFSELDHEHRRLVTNLVKKQQTIITTTDIHLLPKNFLKQAELIEI